MHLGKIDFHILKYTLYRVYHKLCIQNRAKFISRKLRICLQHPRYSFKKYALLFRKLVFLERFSVLETVGERPDRTINRKFAAPANTKVRQSASECVHAEVHASVDNSWLQAYVGDLMVRTDSWGPPASQMVIWGFGLVKHSGMDVQIRSLFKKDGMFSTVLRSDTYAGWQQATARWKRLFFVIYSIEFRFVCEARGWVPALIKHIRTITESMTIFKNVRKYNYYLCKIVKCCYTHSSLLCYTCMSNDCIYARIKY